MAFSDNPSADDRTLTKYLLGALPEEEAARLDELSISNDEFAWRLDAAENDLVDAYVRGELSPEDARQFKAFYLSSARRKEKVQLAQGLLEYERRAAATVKAAERSVVTAQSPVMQSPGRGWSMPRFAFQWGFAVASVALLLFGGYLLVQNLQLRRLLNQVQSEQATMSQHAQDLQKQLEQGKTALDEKAKPENAHADKLDQLTTVSLVLPPPTRGASQLPSVFVHPGTDLVVLVLSLEANDFPGYRAKLRDPVTNRTLWQSSKLTAGAGSQGAAISVSFGAGLLKQQNYIVDLQGIPSHGSAEMVGGYPFRVLLQ